FHSSSLPSDLHSFPTRRSSDLEPLFLLDYIACGEVVPEKVAEIGAGIADGCRAAGCALLGGETAEHPGMMSAHEYDIAGTGVGIDRKSTRLNSSHRTISYAVFC